MNVQLVKKNLVGKVIILHTSTFTLEKSHMNAQNVKKSLDRK